MAELSSMEGAMGSLPEKRGGGRGRGRGGTTGAHLGGAMGTGPAAGGGLRPWPPTVSYILYLRKN
jgi:hypothetical protein